MITIKKEVVETEKFVADTEELAGAIELSLGDLDMVGGGTIAQNFS